MDKVLYSAQVIFCFSEMKLVLYPHGGSGNHGCEAIIRSSKRLVEAEWSLYSNDIEQDKSYGLDSVCALHNSGQAITRWSMSYLKAVVKHRLLGQSDALDELTFQHIVKEAKQSDYFLSIGGDNYCYGANNFIYLVNRMIDGAGVKRILWGASVEPDSLCGQLLDDIKGFYKIWARESLTYEALVAKGLKQTILLPDPAFALEKKCLPLPEGFVEGNTVGINVSPLIIGCETSEGVTLNNYIRLIEYIISNTDMNVALIPHVVWSHNDDRKPLGHLYNMFKDSGRVCMIEDHNCEELKGYISRCRFMVTARTHASIAAYSTCVPTLVVGYSVKARGIAKDLFGTDKNYVIPVQSLKEEKDLLEAFKWLQNNEASVRNHLNAFIPEYTARLNSVHDLILE